MSEYYKSLISDDEVIQALIKESKRREGTLITESSRLKPNLNFFQRTVNHLVSSNKRISKSINNIKGDYSKQPKTHTKHYSDIPEPKRLRVNHAYEKQLILERKINFSKAMPVNIEKESKTKKPYQSSSIRKSNKSLLKYIEELSTDSSESEAERNDISKSRPGKYLNHDSSNFQPRYIERKSSKSKNLPEKYIKIDENSRSDNIISLSSDSDDSLKEIDTKENFKKKIKKK